MRFQFTLDMPAASGHLVHNIVGYVDEIESLEDLAELLEISHFIVVDQIFKEKQPDGSYLTQPVGQIILNTSKIGKAIPIANH